MPGRTQKEKKVMGDKMVRISFYTYGLLLKARPEVEAYWNKLDLAAGREPKPISLSDIIRTLVPPGLSQLQHNGQPEK